MTVRVLRLMEYVYEDLEAAHKDMANWKVQGTFQLSSNRRISSTVLVNPMPYEEPVITRGELNK